MDNNCRLSRKRQALETHPQVAQMIGNLKTTIPSRGTNKKDKKKVELTFLTAFWTIQNLWNPRVIGSFSNTKVGESIFVEDRPIRTR